MAITVIMQDSRPDGAGGTYKKGSTYSLPDPLATYFLDIGLAKRTSTRSEQTGAAISGNAAGQFPSAPALSSQVPVTASITSSGGVDVVVPFAKRRSWLPRNLIDPASGWGKTETGGTVTHTAGSAKASPIRIVATATATGSTARIIDALSLTGLDTSAYYELSINVDSVSLANPAAMVQAWFGFPVAVTEGTQALTGMPTAGNRYSLRFKPASSSLTLRIGIGINVAETTVAGDRIEFSAPSLYKIPSLDFVYREYGYSPVGGVGIAQAAPATRGSCLLAIGDSWSNNDTDWPGVLSSTYEREVLVSATAGHSLASMLTDLNAALATGTSFLYYPYRNVPGIAVICGGINDVVEGINGTAITQRAAALLAAVRALNMIPLYVLQPQASNSIHYSASRKITRTALAQFIAREGCDFIDLQQTAFINPDGTASTTLMLDESGAWLHASAAGVAALVDLIETAVRNIDRAHNVVLKSPHWP